MVEIMKQFMLGLIVGVLLIGGMTWAADVTRCDLYAKFSPRLIEALARVIRDEINILRAEHGLPARTNQQIMNAINARYESIPPCSFEEADDTPK
jgi:hypothetical protein